MISHGDTFFLRHASGRYLKGDVRSKGFEANTPRDRLPGIEVCHRLTEHVLEADWVFDPRPWERFLAQTDWAAVAGQFEIVSGPGCGCCGQHWGIRGAGHIWRCEKHRERNPCAIEGCKRTTKPPADGTLSNDQWLCSEHWRRYVPPRSRERRLYHRHFRRAKRLGWSPDRAASFHAFWSRLIARVRDRATEGFIDEDEINRLMGWGDDK